MKASLWASGIVDALKVLLTLQNMSQACPKLLRHALGNAAHLTVRSILRLLIFTAVGSSNTSPVMRPGRAKAPPEDIERVTF